MSRDLNKVQIIGRLGKDVELRYTQGGSGVASFSVASGREWKDAAGEKQEETEWFNVVAWEKLGEICNNYLKKGDKVYIEGRLKTRSWDDKNTGEKRYMTEVIASDMIMLGSKSDSTPTNGNSAPLRLPTAKPAAPARNVPHGIETDENLPF